MTNEIPHRAVLALRQFTRKHVVEERCDLCSASLSERHEHLFDARERRVACACRACTMLFPETGEAAYRRIVSHASRLPHLRLDAEDFEALGIPVRVAFLYPSRVHDCVFAVYPNGGGAAEATLPRAAWEMLVVQHPTLACIELDVEGLFVNAIGEESDVYRLSVDVGHRIVGTLRAQSGRIGALRTEIRRMLREAAEGRHD